MVIPAFEGFGRKIMVQFSCWRCKKIALKPLCDCLPKEAPVSNLSDLSAPKEWKDGGFYYPTFCPECAEKYERFMKDEDNESCTD